MAIILFVWLGYNDSMYTTQEMQIIFLDKSDDGWLHFCLVDFKMRFQTGKILHTPHFNLSSL